MEPRSLRRLLAASLVLVICLACGRPAQAAAPAVSAQAAMSITLGPASPEIAACLPEAQAQAVVVPGPRNDTLTFVARGLTPFAGFDLYATASPHRPYGNSWPLSIVQADSEGRLQTRVQAVLLGAASLENGESSAAATHLVLFFDDAQDAAPCLGPGPANPTRLAAGRTLGPAALVTATSSTGMGPLARAPFAPPGAGISTPSTFSGTAGRATTFTTACDDPEGWTAIRFIDFRLSTRAGVALLLRLDRPAKRIYLYDAAANRWTGGVAPHAVAALGTPLVQMKSGEVQGTTGTTGKVIWTLVFAKQASGQTFRQSVRVIDLRNQTRGWTDSGEWSVV